MDSKWICFSLINRFGFISLFMVPEFLKSQCTKFAFVYRVGVKEFYNMFYRVVHYGFFTFFQNLRDEGWRWWFTRSWCITPLRYVKGTTTSGSEITIHVNHIKFPFDEIFYLEHFSRFTNSTWKPGINPIFFSRNYFFKTPLLLSRNNFNKKSLFVFI